MDVVIGLVVYAVVAVLVCLVAKKFLAPPKTTFFYKEGRVARIVDNGRVHNTKVLTSDNDWR